MSEQFTLFWNGPFSQWADSPFTFENRISFNRAEQFMMFCKAVLFEDYDTAYKIMQLDDPFKQKKLGRQVKGFDLGAWIKVAKEIVYVGSYLKYTQNTDKFQALMDTDGTTLVEASPYDKIWGIGLAEYDPKAQDRATWDGKNWLGEVLTQIRTDLQNASINEGSIRLCRNLSDKYMEHMSSLLRDYLSQYIQIDKLSGFGIGDDATLNIYTIDQQQSDLVKSLLENFFYKKIDIKEIGRMSFL